MKNKMLYIILSFAVLMASSFMNISSVNANAAGGGASGGGSLTGTCDNTFCGGNELDYESGQYGSAYKIQLVYYDGSQWTILGQGIIYSGTNSWVESKIYTRAERYINTQTAITFASKLHEIVYGNGTDEAITKWFDDNNSQNFKQLAEDMGVKSSDLTKKSTKTRGFNSIGYRFITQKLVAFNGGFQSRKEYASNYTADIGVNCRYGIWDVTPGSCFGTFKDLYTVVDDIGIVAPESLGKQYGVKLYWGYDRLKLTIENSNNPSGSGYGIYEFENPYENNYDYRPDSLCLNCKTTNSNWAYIYTDMANWEGIKASLSSDTSNIKTYFKSKTKGGKTYACREEIKVKYPDKANKVLVEPGRYFTVGLPQRWGALIPNFAPITVERTKECHAYDSNYNDVTSKTTTSEWEKFWNQDSFYKNKDTGTIKITYKEKNGTKKYDGEKNTETYNQRVSDITSNKLTITNSYKLAGTTYQYVRLDSGLSVSKKPNVAYIDLGVANFPISYNNKYDSDNSKSKPSRQAATITLNYEFPEDSQLNKSIGAPNYFGSNNAVSEDIYKKAATAGVIGNNFIQKGSLEDSQYNDLKHTACVLEYCDADGKNCKSGFNSCMSSKINTGKTQTKCDKEDNYTCDINFKGAECKKKGDKYYIDGKEVSKEEYEANGCTCKLANGKYYLDMNEVTKEEYEKVCPLADSECPNNDPCCLGVVNGGCKKIIYRTIDLRNPFPGQDTNKNGRRTGTNWCSYDITTQTLDCSNLNDGITDGIPNAKNPSTTNKTVSKHIKNNAGASEEDIYRQTPQYSITLNSQNIDQIRRYNKEQKKLGGYDDFTLTCREVNNEEIKSNLKAQGIYTTDICRSDFIRKNEFNFNLSGTCASSSWDNLLSCSERSVKE